MRHVQSRVVVVIAAWLAAFGLVMTAAAVPADAAVEGESSTTITLARDRWWDGEVIPVELSVVRDGEPASGIAVVLVDGVWTNSVWPLRQGHASAVVRPANLGLGDHVIEVRHVESSYAQTPYSAATAQVHVDVPARPVLAPQARFYGDPAVVTFDLTGTDLPREGELELGALGTAPIIDGVATFTSDGTEISAGPTIIARQRDAGTGDLLSVWQLESGVVRRPVTLAVSTPGTWQHGAQVPISVQVLSEHGVPTGRVEVVAVTEDPMDAYSLAVANLVDGRAELAVDASKLPVGTRRVEIVFGSAYYDFERQAIDVVVKPKRATTVSVSSTYHWRYATSRRVQVKVSASGALPRGRVDLSWPGHGKVGSATLVDGKASILVGGRAVEPGTRKLVATFVPAVPTDASSTKAWSQRVDKAKPTVRLTMDRTSYPVRANLGASEPGTVRVSTAGMTERGRLILETRSPRATNATWRTRWSTDWTLTTSEKGVQRVKIPVAYLRTADGRPGSVYLRIRYVPADASHVSTVASGPVTIRRY